MGTGEHDDDRPPAVVKGESFSIDEAEAALDALDEADDIPELTAEQLARARPAWAAFAARAFGQWVFRLSH